MNKKICFLVCLTALIALPLTAQQLTREIKKQTIDTLAVALTERYAYKDVAIGLKKLLLQNLQTGKYDQYTSAEAFSKAVTIDLRSLNKDKHLALNLDPQTAASTAQQNNNPETPQQRAKRVSDFNRQMNFGFEKLQFFPGNIGYVKFNYFDAYLDYSGKVIDASFDFLKNSDAIIIDLRDNTGGASATVAYIAGLFFDTTILIGTSYNRYTDSTTNEYLQAREMERRLLNAHIYILTSKTTISGGEALAYILKYQKKAKVIGETSAGAANPGRVVRINSQFTAFIPNRHSMNAVSGTNWEGTGVPVDIAAKAGKALNIARIEALQALKQKATDSNQVKKLNTYLRYVQALDSPYALSEKELKEYTGSYENGRTIQLEEGKLLFRGFAETGGVLIPVSTDQFMTAEGDVTITFKRNAQHQIVSLVSQWTLGGRPSTSLKIGA